MKENTIFKTLSPTKLFFVCAVPNVISMVVMSLYTIIDGIFVGRYMGADALAAINIVMPGVMITFALADLIAVGSSVQIAIKLGENNNFDANKIFSFCFAIIIIMAFIVGGITFFTAEYFLRMITKDENIIRMSAAYIKVFALFSPTTMIFFAIDNYLKICEKIKYSMNVNIIVSTLNVILDWIFIVEFKWGIFSAALATCISITVGSIICLIPFLRNKLSLKFVKPKLPFSAIFNIIINGSSEFFSNISSNLYMIIVNITLLKISGVMAVTVFSIIMYVDTIANTITIGMSDSLLPAISYNFGAKNLKKIVAIEKMLFGAGFIVSISVMFFMFFGGDKILHLFIINDKELLGMAVYAMKIFSFSYVVSWISVIVSSLLTALNKPTFSLILAVCEASIFPIISLFILSKTMGLNGVWATVIVSGFLSASLSAIFLKVTAHNIKRSYLAV